MKGSPVRVRASALKVLQTCHFSCPTRRRRALHSRPCSLTLRPYRRIAGKLAGLGARVSTMTVRELLRESRAWARGRAGTLVARVCPRAGGGDARLPLLHRRHPRARTAMCSSYRAATASSVPRSRRRRPTPTPRAGSRAARVPRLDHHLRRRRLEHVLGVFVEHYNCHRLAWLRPTQISRLTARRPRSGRPSSEAEPPTGRGPP